MYQPCHTGRARYAIGNSATSIETVRAGWMLITLLIVPEDRGSRISHQHCLYGDALPRLTLCAAAAARLVSLEVLSSTRSAIGTALPALCSVAIRCPISATVRCRILRTAPCVCPCCVSSKVMNFRKHGSVAMRNSSRRPQKQLQAIPSRRNDLWSPLLHSLASSAAVAKN